MTIYRRPDPLPVGIDVKRPRAERATPMDAIDIPRLEFASEPGLQRDDLHHAAARAIFQAIASNKFPEGSQLPNEADLGNQLGISRTALREAVKGLVSKGILQTRRRTGTLVLSRIHWNMLDADLMNWSRKWTSSEQTRLQMIEVLLAIEPAAAALVARGRDPGLRAAILRRRDDLVRQAGQPGETAAAAYVDFHRTLIVASRNQYFITIFNSMMGHVQRHEAPFLVERLKRLDARSYAALVDAILAGDADGASAAMTRILAHETSTAKTLV